MNYQQASNRQNYVPQYQRSITPTQVMGSPFSHQMLTSHRQSIPNNYTPHIITPPFNETPQKRQYNNSYLQKILDAQFIKEYLIANVQKSQQIYLGNIQSGLLSFNILQIQSYQDKYSSNKKPYKPMSILLQLLKEPKPSIPQSVYDFLDKPALLDLNVFISQQIYKYILLNDNKYSGDKTFGSSMLIDVTSFKLTNDQQSDPNLKKSVMILLNQYLQFIINLIKEISLLFDKTQLETPKSHNYYKQAPTSQNRNEQNLTAKQYSNTPQSKISTDEHLSKLENQLVQKELEQMKEYTLKNNKKQSFYDEENVLIMKYDDLQQSALDNANQFLSDVYDKAQVGYLPIYELKNKEMDNDESDQEGQRFQLDEWD